MSKGNKDWMSIRIDSNTKKKLNDMAKADGRTLTNMIQFLLNNEVAKRAGDK